MVRLLEDTRQLRKTRIFMATTAATIIGTTPTIIATTPTILATTIIGTGIATDRARQSRRQFLDRPGRREAAGRQFRSRGWLRWLLRVGFKLFDRRQMQLGRSLSPRCASSMIFLATNWVMA